MNTQSQIFPTYAQPEISFERGEGSRLYDDKGNGYLDLTAGIAVNALGHANPHLVEALKVQAEKLWHTSNLFPVAGQRKVAGMLCANTFADRVFFTNSGAEALECAIKTARRFHYEKGDKDRVNILTFEGAFHGRTLATITAGGQPKYLEGFGPKVPGFINLPFGDHDALKEAADETCAAILVEPIQGEGGIRPVPNHCLRGLRELCDERGILLIYDEVQTGVGRTGKLFAHEWAGANGEAAPDLMAIAKGIGGGFPVGACLATEEVGVVMTPGTHGTTFGGNPLAMAVAAKVLEIITAEGFLQSVQEKALHFKQALAEIVDRFPDHLEEVRGSGLLLGVKAKVPNTYVISALRARHVLAVGAGDNVIRFVPPLTITNDELSEAKDMFALAMEDLSAQPAAATL